MKVEQVVEEFLNLLSEEKVKQAEELVMEEARGREDKLADFLLKTGAEVGNKGSYFVALHCFEAARKVAKSEDLMNVCAATNYKPL